MKSNLSVRLLAVLITSVIASSGYAGLVLVENFTGIDAVDATKSAVQFNGSSLTFGGHRLTSQLDGAEGSQLAYAADRVLVAGLGVGQPTADGPNVGFTRSINNGDAASNMPDESIAMSLAPGEGISTLYIANGLGGGPSVVTIGGFTADPLATSANGAVAYSDGLLTWTITSQSSLTLGGLVGNQISTLGLANAGASVGATLVLGNGTDPSEANEFGLRGFGTVVVPEPGTIALLLTASFCVWTRVRTAHG